MKVEYQSRLLHLKRLSAISPLPINSIAAAKQVATTDALDEDVFLFFSGIVSGTVAGFVTLRFLFLLF